MKNPINKTNCPNYDACLYVLAYAAICEQGGRNIAFKTCDTCNVGGWKNDQP